MMTGRFVQTVLIVIAVASFAFLKGCAAGSKTETPITAETSNLSAIEAADAAVKKAAELVGDDPYLKLKAGGACQPFNPDAPPVVRNPDDDPRGEIIQPYRAFDNLYFIGGKGTGSWLITTSEGYIMIDALFGDSPETLTIPGMEALGLDPAKLKYILITHAGPDHAGGAKYFQEKYGTRIVMSQNDWDGILNPKPGSWVLDTRPMEQRPSPEREWVGPPELDIVSANEDTITLGDTTVEIYFTPRRSDGGGNSYIVPVFDNGEPHMWATYGNGGQPASMDDKRLHRASLAYFMTKAAAAKADVILSVHPGDGSWMRAEELKNRRPGELNPFVIGVDGVSRYLNIMDQCTAVTIARTEAGLNPYGKPM